MAVRPRPYVGITGFKRREQVQSLLDIDCGDRMLMVGVIASYRTIVLDQSKPDGRSPKRGDIAGIFPSDRDTLNLVHYFTEVTGLEVQLYEAMRYGGPNCHGLQLNITWPDPVILRGFRQAFPGKKLVLQVGGRDRPLEREGDPGTLAHRVVFNYAGLIDYVLLDASGGLGKEFDPMTMARYLEPLSDLIEQEQLPMRLGVAGGLHASNLHLVRELLRFSGLSCDAEGKLHSGPGRLDITACRAYLRAAADLP